MHRAGNGYPVAFRMTSQPPGSRRNIRETHRCHCFTRPVTKHTRPVWRFRNPQKPAANHRIRTKPTEAARNLPRPPETHHNPYNQPRNPAPPLFSRPQLKSGKPEWRFRNMPRSLASSRGQGGDNYLSEITPIVRNIPERARAKRPEAPKKPQGGGNK